MRAQQQRLRVFGLELLLQQVRPQAARSTHLGNLRVKVHANGPEERQARRKLVNVQPGLETYTKAFF
jgi:hypothetical protein